MVITRSKEGPIIHLNVEGKPVSQVDKFVYFGHQVGESGRCDGEIWKRIEIARSVLIKMRDILTSRKVKLGTRKRILRCYVWNSLLYGSETRTLIKDTTDRLKVFILLFLNADKLVKKGSVSYFQPACLYLEIRGRTLIRV